MSALRLMLYDRTCAGRGWRPGLARAWQAGDHLYRALGRLDETFGAATWTEALAWLVAVRPGANIAEIQVWAHGRFGEVLMGEDRLHRGALDPAHPHHAALAEVRQRLLPGARGLWWFRTCETFGSQEGQRFARAWTAFFGCRAAGHTHVIGGWQSGLHTLMPGDEPSWSADEGVAPDGSARSSGPGAPHTITFLHGRVPLGF